MENGHFSYGKDAETINGGRVLASVELQPFCALASALIE